MRTNYLTLLFAVVLLSATASGQRTLEYDRSVVSQVRIDLRELGYPPVDVIPSGESAIHELAIAPDGQLYGITSGKRSHLFVLSPVHGYVQPLGFLNGVARVDHSLVIDAEGAVFIGAGDAGGHLYRYSPANDYRKPIRVDAPLNVTDLGGPVAGDGIYCLAIDRAHKVLYGLTSPGGSFFSYSIAEAKFAVHGKVAENKIPGEKFETEKNLGLAIVVDLEGNAFTSGENGFMYRFHAAGQRLERLAIRVPSVPGREPYVHVDRWTVDGQGNLYGGTSDGHLFRFNPKTLAIENLGKPLSQYRIRGLVFAPNRRIYGVGGDDDDMARLFSYDPKRGVYEILGMIDVNRRPFYTWQAYVVDAMAIGNDGVIYMGQAERKSKLYLFYASPDGNQP